MSLTNAQYQTLKTAIASEVDSTFVGYRTAGATGAMADWYNLPSTTDAWRSDVSAQDMDEASDYSSFDAVAAGKRDAWALFLQYAPRNMAKNKNRKVVTDVWGNATSGSIAESILQASVKKASKGEMVYGGTSATTGTVTATKRNLVYTFQNNDIVLALAS